MPVRGPFPFGNYLPPTSFFIRPRASWLEKIAANLGAIPSVENLSKGVRRVFSLRVSMWLSQHAAVFSIDEKTAIQALDRPRTRPGSSSLAGKGTTPWLRVLLTRDFILLRRLEHAKR